MRFRRKQGRKLNNAGMSLVEVVVAIFILAVVTTTILSIFVFTIRLNARSRTRQQTTAAAQAVMENFKAYSVRELCEQFDGVQKVVDSTTVPPVVITKKFSVSGAPADGTMPTAQTTQVVRLLGSATGGGSSTPIVLAQNDEDAIEELLKSKDDINFQLRNLEYQNEHYDVEIQLRRHEGSHVADMETLIYENRTEDNSAVYVGDIGMDAAALAGIADKVAETWTAQESAIPGATPAPTYTGSEVDINLINITKRELTAIVRQDGGDYVVEMGCKYWYTVGSYSYDDASGTTHTLNAIPETEYTHMMDTRDIANPKPLKVIFRKPMAAESSINLTLYYYPAYHDVGSLQADKSGVSIARDNIVIKNELPVPLGGTRPEVKCYLYKQRNMAFSDNRISHLDLAYGPSLELTLGNEVYIYDDNLDTVLGDSSAVYTYDPAGNITNRYCGISYVAENATVSGPGVAPVPALPSGLEPDKTAETVRLMYEITVLVYKQGELADSGPASGASALAELKGTLIE